MTTYTLGETELENLKDKVILITGCATGIGRAAAVIAHQNGAKLALADWNEEKLKELVAELGSDDTVIWRKTDVSAFDDVLEIFQATWKKFGIINAVLSNAGVVKEDMFKDEVDPSTGKLMPPDLGSLHVNLNGQLYAAKCAVHYFAKWPDTRCQIVMTSSAAGFFDTPPNHLYGAAKAGIIGFMRSVRTQLIKKNITTNVVCPWMTKTPMLPQWIVDMWKGLPENEPWGVAHALLLPVLRPEMNGKSLFVGGHQIVDLEEKLHETQPLWMGEKLSADFEEGQRRLIS